MFSKMLCNLALFSCLANFVLANFIAPGPLPLTYFHLMSSGSPYKETNERLLTDYNITYINYQSTGPDPYNYTVARGRVESIGSGHEFDTNKPLTLAQDVHGHLYRVDPENLMNTSARVTADSFSLFFGGFQFENQEPGSEFVCQPVKAHESLNCSIAGRTKQNFFWTPDNACDVVQVFFQDTAPPNLSGYLGVNQCQNFAKVNFTVVPAKLGYSPPAYKCDKPTRPLPAAAGPPKPSRGFYLSVSSTKYGDANTVLQVEDGNDLESTLPDGAITYLGRRSNPPTLAVEPSSGRIFDPTAFGKAPSFLAVGGNGLPSSALSMQPVAPSQKSGPKIITCQPFTDGHTINCALQASPSKFWISNSTCTEPYVFFQATQPPSTSCAEYVEATIRAHAAPQPPPRPQFEMIASLQDKAYPMNGQLLLTPVRDRTPISFENNLNGPGRIYSSHTPSEQGFAAFDPQSDPSVFFTKTLSGTQTFLSCAIDAAKNLNCGVQGGKFILDWYCPINPLTGNTPILGCPMNWQTGFAKCNVTMRALNHWYPVGWF